MTPSTQQRRYGGEVDDSLVTRLLPTLVQRSEAEFNVFDVMHHGTHEKQLSNLFAWLLTADGSHELGDRFVGWFMDEEHVVHAR